MATPSIAQHSTNEDGSVSVAYFTHKGEGKVLVEDVTYADKRTASIEATLRLFPGTSREWLERMHAAVTYTKRETYL